MGRPMMSERNVRSRFGWCLIGSSSEVLPRKRATKTSTYCTADVAVSRSKPFQRSNFIPATRTVCHSVIPQAPAPLVDHSTIQNQPPPGGTPHKSLNNSRRVHSPQSKAGGRPIQKATEPSYQRFSKQIWSERGQTLCHGSNQAHSETIFDFTTYHRTAVQENCQDRVSHCRF